MRDPKRIPGIIRRLQQVWEAHPDLRLGQLVLNSSLVFGNDTVVYYKEDKEVIDAIEKVHGVKKDVW